MRLRSRSTGVPGALVCVSSKLLVLAILLGGSGTTSELAPESAEVSRSSSSMSKSSAGAMVGGSEAGSLIDCRLDGAGVSPGGGAIVPGEACSRSPSSGTGGSC